MQEIYDAVMDGREISRRAFLKGAAVAGLMALGAGCLGGGEKESSVTPEEIATIDPDNPKTWIKEIGPNRYKVILPEETDTWMINYDDERFKGDRHVGRNEYNDEILVVGDGIDELHGGFIEKNGKTYGVIVVDEDTFEMYGGTISYQPRGATQVPEKSEFQEVYKGIYVKVLDLERETYITVDSVSSSREAKRALNERGTWARFVFDRK